MKAIKNIFLSLGIFFAYPVLSVGGLPQSQMLCDQNAYPGVGRLTISYLKNGHGHTGTAQLLPHSNGLLAVTARHCIEERDGGPITVTFGNKTIKVVEVFPHSQDKRDIAIIRFEESPGIPDELLPQFPTMDFIQLHHDKETSGQLVGFGNTSKDNEHPAFLFTEETPQKRAGKIILDDESDLFNSRDLTSAPWIFTAHEHTEDRVFAGGGDSGGPLIIDNTLAGVLVSSTSEKDKIIEDCIHFIDDEKAQEFKKNNVEITDKTTYHGRSIDFYVYKRNVYVHIHDQKSLTIQKFYRIKHLIFNDLSFQPPWRFKASQNVMRKLLHSTDTAKLFNMTVQHEFYLAHVDHYVNISKCMDFIKNVYERCNFSTEFLNGFCICNNIKEDTIRTISSSAVNDYLDQLKKTRNDLPIFLKSLETHIELYIRAKRALGLPVNEYELLIDNNFEYHVKRFVKEQERLKRLPADIKQIDIKRTAFLPSYAKFRDVEKIRLIDSETTSAAPLFGLQKLTYLDLSGSLITSLRTLMAHYALRELRLNNTPLSNLEGIQNLSNLRKLYLRNTKIKDLRAIANMTKLRVIDIRDCPNLDDEESIAKLEAAGCYFIRNADHCETAEITLGLHDDNDLDSA